MRLLVVEDEARIATFLIKGLTADGFGVDWAPTGTDALNLVVDGTGYDLVLLDLGLPDIDGLEVLRRLRASGDETPVIVLTAREADRAESLALGADEYLIKPTPFGDLLARVRHEVGAETRPG